MNTNQKGLTLIEMMIAIVIGFIVVAATLVILLTNIKSSNETIKMTRLNQEMQAIMTLITRDIRRAGFFNDNTATVNPYEPTMANGNSDTITLAYDIDEDGSDAAAEVNSETINYRKNGTEIQYQIGGAGWTALNDPEVSFVDFEGSTVTNDTFIVEQIAVGSVIIRAVTINLEAQLTDDNTVSRKLSETIRIRNDELN